MRVVGLDIGGANLKASDGDRVSVSQPFPMWRRVDELTDAVRTVLAQFAACDAVGVTMTGELADCFATKGEGVARILAAVEHASDRPLWVWQTPGEFVPPQVALEFPKLTAAANWHALATWAGRMTPRGGSILIDVGSTTSDVIPLADGFPVPSGRTDVERLLCGELVYTGIRRTPLCAIGDRVPVRNQRCPLAAELFATIQDVWIVLGDLEPDAACSDTADGRPATREAALSRIARMVCCDRSELSDTQLVEIAQHLGRRQVETLATAVETVAATLPAPPRSVLLSGDGEFLAARAIALSTAHGSLEIVRLSTLLGPEHSKAACAYALARLGCERLD